MKVLAAGAAVAVTLIVTTVSVTSGRPSTEAWWLPPEALAPADPVVERVLLQPIARPIPSALAAGRAVAPTTLPAMGARGIPLAALDEVVNRYCGSCHNPTRKSGNLILRGYTIDSLVRHEREIAEHAIVKLRTDMMPPPGSRRPTADTLLALVETLEQLANTVEPPNPGSRPFQRLNRPEYERVIQDLLGLRVNAGDYLPLDTKSANFDNIADAQALSTTLLDAYLNAAAAVSRMAIGDRNAVATQSIYRTSPFVSQHPWDHVPGTPYGSRGGMVFEHAFPADGEYEFRLNVAGGVGLHLEDLDISIDGQQVALLKYDKGIARNSESADMPAGADYVRSAPIPVKAGQRTVTVAFVRRTDGPYEDLIRPHDWSRASGGTGAAGVTEPPALMETLITGPTKVSGVSDNAVRQRIFTCRPSERDAQRACADQILTRLATRAYRRPITDRDRQSLMTFYDKAATDPVHGFEDGVRSGLQALLASPYFVFRFEPVPETARPGTDVVLGDVELASRLSFFLWGTIPDERLLSLAQKGELSKPAVMQAEVKRMLADKRSEALATRFAAQWLRLQDLEKVHPDAFLFPDYDAQLADAMQEETERFFEHLVRNDRSFLELYTADYTFVNERLARHYGIPNVSGPAHRLVKYPTDERRGILGHGSVLVQTSLGNRTSPVLRGKWVMEVLLGSDPPPPPPNVPDLEQTAEAKDGKVLTTRERMEMHRENPTCNACHQYMDPIGLALDGFDVTGRIRYRENGAPLDTRGRMYDGMDVSSMSDLNRSLLSRPIPLVRTFTQNLMAYATGRRMEAFDQPAIRAIANDAARQDYRISAFVLGVVNSRAFRTMRVESVATDDAQH
jgi:hypothetical protein